MRNRSKEETFFIRKIIQVDNGSAFVNDEGRTDRKSAFEKAVKALGIGLRRIRPYSLWQNGKVERSHIKDGIILYNCKVFTSEKRLMEQVKKHEKRYNNTVKTVLKFKSPNQVVSEYFQSATYVLATKKNIKSK